MDDKLKKWLKAQWNFDTETGKPLKPAIEAPEIVSPDPVEPLFNIPGADPAYLGTDPTSDVLDDISADELFMLLNRSGGNGFGGTGLGV